jgi:hypothetical protein
MTLAVGAHSDVPKCFRRFYAVWYDGMNKFSWLGFMPKILENHYEYQLLIPIGS